MRHADSELDSLKYQLKAGHEAWQSSQGMAAKFQEELAEEESQKQLLHHELQIEKDKTDLLDARVCNLQAIVTEKSTQMRSLQSKVDSQSPELTTLRHRLNALEAQGSVTLPERVSKLLSDREEEVREARGSVTALIQKQTESHKVISELVFKK